MQRGNLGATITRRGRGTTASTPRMKRSTDGSGGRPGAPTETCGRRPVPRRPGNGKTAKATAQTKRQFKQSDSSNKVTAQAALETHRWKTETAWTPTPGRKRSASSNGISLMTRTAQMQTEMVQTEVVGLASLFPACLRAARATVASNRIGMPSRQPGWPLEFGPSLAMGSASGELPARPSWLNPIGSTQLAEKQKGRTTLGTEVQTTNPTSTSRRMLSPRRWEPCG